MLIAKREIYAGRVVRLDVETVELPNGHRIDLEIMHHPGGAAVVAVDDAGRVCLLRQFRHAAGGWVWELPAGKLEPGEPPGETVRRELVEEGGVRARHWEELGTYLSSPGVFTERIHLYLATGLEPAAHAPEAGEVFEVHWIPFEVAVGRVHSGEYTDGKTCLGLLKAQHRLAAPKT
ncbi:MAG: NUDIX hydrolase [Steroidobacteraceae bacterium]|jgi:ADP-ribose pyrophosphatase|nr:NUDIX hydrolase [Steroidobacteraceae bacterium]